MNLGVLLLTCKGEPRITSLTKQWVEQCAERTAQFHFAQSGGRVQISYKVYDWFELNMTGQEWNNHGFNVGNVVRPVVSQALSLDLSTHDHFALVIDKADARLGATSGVHTHLAARDLNPAILQHELSHVYGAPESSLDTPQGPQLYGNLFCIMGFERQKYSFSDPTLTLPFDVDEADHSLSGPGMTAPTMMTTGWLDFSQRNQGQDISASLGTGSMTLQLAALRGAPAPSYQGPPVFAWADLGDRKIIEYRQRDGWDRAMPDPGPGATGWIVFHRTPLGMPVTNLQIGAMPAAPGQTFSFGEDNPLDIFNPGPLKVTVMSVHAASSTVNLHLSRRKAKQLPGSIGFGGVDVGAGGWVWTPGRGFRPVPPHSPLLAILDKVADLSQLQELAGMMTGPEAEGLLQATSQSLVQLQESVMRLERVPAKPALFEALETIAELQMMQQDGSALSDQQLISERLNHLHDVVSRLGIDHAERRFAA
jgi:hypothetical protein